MSYTQLYGVEQNGDVKFYNEVKNSWAGGMHVWNTLNEKYALNDSFSTMYKMTWGSFNKGVYEHYEDVVLGSTFDYCIIKKEDFDKIIDAMKQYSEEYPSSNYDEQLKIIEKMKTDETVSGVAWCQTSVADDIWDHGYNEETDEVIPYNLNKGDKHWFLFNEPKEI